MQKLSISLSIDRAISEYIICCSNDYSSKYFSYLHVLGLEGVSRGPAAGLSAGVIKRALSQAFLFTPGAGSIRGIVARTIIARPTGKHSAGGQPQF